MEYVLYVLAMLLMVGYVVYIVHSWNDLTELRRFVKDMAIILKDDKKDGKDEKVQ